MSEPGGAADAAEFDDEYECVGIVLVDGMDGNVAFVVSRDSGEHFGLSLDREHSTNLLGRLTMMMEARGWLQ